MIIIIKSGRRASTRGPAAGYGLVIVNGSYADAPGDHEAFARRTLAHLRHIPRLLSPAALSLDAAAVIIR